MPIYPYKCDECSYEIEVMQDYEEKAPSCPTCGAEMRIKPTFPVMVKIKGAGGYPSRRKFVGGTAPYTSRSTKAWLDSDPFEANKKS